MFYFTYILMGIILLPGIIYAVVVQSRVSNAFKTYSKVPSVKGITAQDACKMLLQNAGITDVEIVRIKGYLTDHYNPKTKTLGLSEGVYNSTSISALGIAAHEAGHAIQHAENYAPLKTRNVLGTLSNICSNMLWPLVIIGILLSAFSSSGTSLGDIFLWGGVIFFGISVIFSIATLPVEFNASKRALANLTDGGILDTTEVKGAKVVLSAAAQTYVAALVVSILSFLRFILAIFIIRND
ncbi:MAG: zinc metallopeptidase [Clostridia bacterium]|nr:zinc metallopeptidase [Clostridia bacterium]